MPIYKKDGKYYARINYVSPLGKYKTKQSKYFNTKREAEQEEHRLALENSKDREITFQYVYDSFCTYKKNSVSVQTFLTYRNMWKYIKDFANIPISDLTAKQYQEFKNSLDNYYWETKDGEKHYLSFNYKNDIHSFVKQLITFSDLMYGVNNKVPQKLGGFSSREVKDEMKVINEKTFKTFLSYFDDDIVYKSLFTTLYYEGLRKGEANGLTWKCVNFDDNTIFIKQSVYLKIKGIPVLVSQPKTPKSIRTLPMQKDVAKCLKSLYNYYQDFANFSDNWYCFGGYKPLSETTIENKKNSAFDSANLERIRIHDFRHSFASLLISKGVDVVQVSRALGHSNITQTLNTYSHMFKNSLSETFKKI